MRIKELAAAVTILLGPALLAQGRGGPASANVQEAQQAMREGRTADALAAVRREAAANPTSTQAANLLDVLGATKEAKAIFQRQIDAATEPADKAAAQRAMAMSFAFDGDCANTIKFEQMVIAYWVTRESVEPQNAFYQQGEMANEGARVCIDVGDLKTAEAWYRKGAELGLKEPEPKRNPASLWDYRLAHALARIAARRGDKAEAARQVQAARKALDSDPTMAAPQERFFTYLTGYVALYMNDLQTAEADLTKAVAISGNATDPFMRCLLAMVYEKLGQNDRARENYLQAYNLATGHNPPAAFTRPFARKKIEGPK